MNTKFPFVLFLVIIALLITACLSTDTRSSTPIDPAQLIVNETVVPVPVTGNPSAESVRQEAEPRLQSGEVLLSDNNNPDVQLNIQTDIQQNLPNECMSEDSLPRLYGGCTE